MTVISIMLSLCYISPTQHIYRSLKGLETPRWAYSIYNIQQERKKIGGYSVNPCSSTEIQQNDLILTTTSLKDLRR